MQISVLTDFAPAPGPRRKIEGKNSAEAFRENVLLPALQHAIETGEELIVNLDGTAGYGPSFLEESFGGLVRICGYDWKQLRKTLIIVSNDEPYLIADIQEYMQDASNTEG